MWGELNIMVPYAAGLYLLLVGVLVLFQFALAAGAPWGHLAMGGKFPGRFPVGMRILSVVNAMIIAAMGWIVASRAGQFTFMAYDFPAWVIWLVVAFGVLAMIANLATPSKPERALWGPVTVVMLLCTLVVALAPSVEIAS